jgi:nucleoside-diphosphate-sugar epimerase
MSVLHPVAGERVLVTGGAGFVGRGLVCGLAAEGVRVSVLDNDSRGSKRKLRALGFTPKVPLAQGSVQTVAWYEAHGGQRVPPR